MERDELAVVEGRWLQDQNLSVSTVFNTLSDLLYETPHGYFHHHFSNAASLEHVVKHVADSRARFLYLGAHGNENGIYGSLGDDHGQVSRTVLRNALWRCWDEGVGSFDGLFFGACSFVTERNAKFLLCGDKAPKSLKWVAGYSEDANWVDSTLLDVLFFKRVLERTERTPVKRVEYAAERIGLYAEGLCSYLGFQVYVRSRGRRSGVRPLIKYQTEWEREDD